MPTASSILSWATAVAADYRWLAIVWHVALGALLIMLVSRRLSRRLARVLLVLPVISVSVVAWLSQNPFNGVAFAVLAVVLLRAARVLPGGLVTYARRGWVVPGAVLVAFGWAYPHFVKTDTWTAYAYASPFGILPCPTLAVVIGLSLVFGLHAAGWGVPLVVAGVAYGLIGVLSLRVALDVWLLAGSALLGALVLTEGIGGRVRASADEKLRRLPGDELIPGAGGALTHAVTIAGPPSVVWPWLVQMGAGSRAGWYSYDFLDNGRRPSATRVVPELQDVRPGTVFPAMPRVTEGFVLLAFDAQRSLILGWPGPNRSPMVTWAFILEPLPGDRTRLIVRVRGAQGYSFLGLPVWISGLASRIGHFVMQRKQLLGIAARAAS